MPRSISRLLSGLRPGLLPGLLLALLQLSGCSDSTGLSIAEERVGSNEAEIEATMTALTKQITLQRAEARNDPMVRRFNQPKTIACLDGTLEVGALEERLAVGLFSSPASYPVRMRFANATQFDDREKDLRGLSIKVLNVSGAVSVNGERGIQDFTLNSHPALFAGTPEDFLSFVEASASDSLLWFFLNPFDSHLKSLWIVLSARDNPTSPLNVDYFSTTPYLFGEGSAVKYSVRACNPPGSHVAADDENYLRRALQHDLSDGPQCLDFMVQFQSDPDLMPMEDASVTWPEDVSPFRSVARITIEPQEFSDAATLASCENMQFNPWNGLAEHRPLGGINRVRRNLYRDLGEFRTEENKSRSSP